MKKEPTKRNCIVCKKDFMAKREDAKFCSPNCRQKYVRNPQSYMIDEALTAKSEVKKEMEKQFEEAKKQPRKSIFDGIEIKKDDVLPSKIDRLKKFTEERTK